MKLRKKLICVKTIKLSNTVTFQQWLLTATYKPCIHPHPLTPTHTSHKNVTPTNTQLKTGHKHPHITERNNGTCLTHDLYVKSIPFLQYEQVSSFLRKIHLLIFFYWILLKLHLNLLFGCLFSTISWLHISVWNIFVFFRYVLLLLYKIVRYIMHSSQSKYTWQLK